MILWERVSELSTCGITRIVEFSKQVPGFSTLTTSDQITLLKGSCLEILVGRGVFLLGIIYYSHLARDHYLGQYYILRHVYHTKTKNGMYSRTCLFPECHCYIPNVNNRFSHQRSRPPKIEVFPRPPKMEVSECYRKS